MLYTHGPAIYCELRRHSRRPFLGNVLDVAFVRNPCPIFGTRRFITVFKVLPLVPLLSQMNPFTVLLSYFFKIQFNIFPSRSGSPTLSSLQFFLPKFCMHFSCVMSTACRALKVPYTTRNKRNKIRTAQAACFVEESRKPEFRRSPFYYFRADFHHSYPILPRVVIKVTSHRSIVSFALRAFENRPQRSSGPAALGPGQGGLQSIRASELRQSLHVAQLYSVRPSFVTNLFHLYLKRRQ
jgi:hypothetical protein